MSTESSPLLSNEKDCNLHYGQLSAAPEADRQATYVTVPPIGPNELPPPYTPSHGNEIPPPFTPHGNEIPPPYTPSPHGVPMITCEVCGFVIDITGRWDLHVIKCSSCNEATPIKSAPPGKKYVRCQCNCLLICKSSSQRILCPRNNCTRLINLIPVQTTNPSSLSGMCQVSCAYCQCLFMFNTLTLLDCCPHCHKVSSIAKRYSVSLGNKCAFAACMMFIISLCLTVGTYSYGSEFEGIYLVYLGFFIVSVMLFLKSVYYFTMKTSSTPSV